MMRSEGWLVTGAAGFIGSNLCEYLLEAGHKVVGFDNFLTGKKSNIKRLKAHAPGRFSFVEGSIEHRKSLALALDGCGVVVNLAAQVSVQRSIDDPFETNGINITGFLNTLAAAGEGQCRRFIYTSSCAIYGDSEQLPLSENVPPRPLSPYAVSKLTNECYARTLARRWPNMVTIGLRLFNIYGPWQDPDGAYAAVIPRWISQCLRNEQPEAYGDGSATRDFCFVRDVCRQIHELGINDGAPESGEVFNIGTGVSTRLDSLFKTILGAVRAADVPLTFDSPRYMPWRAGDIVHSVADISRAWRALGFEAKIDLRSGIESTLSTQYGLRTTSAVEG